MPTPRETILTALHARLSALPATALRGDVLPDRVPAAGLLILRDGEPGEPQYASGASPAQSPAASASAEGFCGRSSTPSGTTGRARRLRTTQCRRCSARVMAT
jgi:hypothetical protein